MYADANAASTLVGRGYEESGRDRVERESEVLLRFQQEQVERFGSIMRRVEDLAERVVGPVPCGEGASGTKPVRSGFVGVLADLNDMRDQIAERTAAALDRIERVL